MADFDEAAKRCFLATALSLVVSSASYGESLQILHIDVDQGDSTLFVSPSGNTMLVDTGKNGHGSRIRAAMASAGVTRIDHLVTTHYHEDHYGGADELVTGDNPIEIVQVHDRGDKMFLPDEKLQGDRFVEYETALGHRAHQLMRGETIPLDPAMVVTCIASGSVVLGEEPVSHGAHENDMSIALLIQYGGFRYFVGGDIEEHTETKIAERDLVLDVDVYQADHHGSHTSSVMAFLKDLTPTLVVISNGDHGTFMHPRRITLKSLRELSPTPTILQLNKYTKGREGGNVLDDFISDLSDTGSEENVLLIVDEDGSFSARYRNITLPFQTKTRDVRSGILIVSLLPDPIGSDRELEEVELKNSSDTAIDLAGWFLRDASGRVWSLAAVGGIPASTTRSVVRAGMAMSLNNAADTIELVSPIGNVVDQLSYSGVRPGERVVRPDI